MVALLSKPTKSDGFEQIVDFLNAHPIREVQIHARVDGKKIVITESSVRRNLQLADEEGIDCLPNYAIFKQLALMGLGKGFSDRVTHLFQTMVIQNQSELGEGSTMPTDPHHTPTILQPSSSQPQKTQKPRKPKRKDTQVPQPSGPTDNVADEAVHKELGDSLVRVATTASSLEAKHDNGNITKTQSKAAPNEPSSQGTDLGGVPRSQETMRDTTAQTRVESSRDEESLGEDASKQERRIDVIDADKDITLVNDADNEMFDVDDLGVSTAATTVTITTEEITLAQALEALKTSKPKAKGIVFQEPSKSTTTKTIISSQQSQDMDRGIMIEEPVKPKKKDQIRLDEEVALKLQAEFDEKERLAREKAKKEQEANIALIETWDDIQAKIDIDHHKIVEDDKEKAELKQLMETIPDEEEVAIDAIRLAVKSPRIVDWKIHKEEKKIYYQIVRADEKSQMYMIFSQMLKSFNREDLEDLYKLSMQIYMLVEKKYPLTPPTLSMMLEKKLQIYYERQSSRSTPDQQIADEIPTPRLLVRTTWEDTKDVLAIKTWAGHSDAQREALWQARYEDQREIHDLRMQRAADQRELQELREQIEIRAFSWYLFMIRELNSVFHELILFELHPNVTTRQDKMGRDVLTVGSTMRILLLCRGEYSQWVERFMNYLEEQTDEEAMINSIKNGDQPLPRVTQVSIVGTSSNEQPPLKDKSMWPDQEKKI
uniref:Uncharacterized protein n=1 Tax=Tanacetum cinerariifolium TaxID=118510 RepID=A0A699HSA9_TANCI|nr:hypothetical protein [Tanacetum cinerariifolium]